MKRALVRKAALMLDKRYPGWHRQVRLSSLDLVDENHCVTAQLGLTDTERYELPFTVLDATGWERPDGDYSHVEFDLEEGVQVPWEEEIRARRKRVPA